MLKADAITDSHKNLCSLAASLEKYPLLLFTLLGLKY